MKEGLGDLRESGTSSRVAAAVVLVEDPSEANSVDTTMADTATRMTTKSRETTTLKSVVTTLANLTAVPTTTSTTNGEQVAETLKVPGISGSLTD